MKKSENSATTYYLRSSVLGGQVVCELNGNGGFARGYVYLGGQMVAIQANDTVTYWALLSPSGFMAEYGKEVDACHKSYGY